MEAEMESALIFYLEYMYMHQLSILRIEDNFWCTNHLFYFQESAKAKNSRLWFLSYFIYKCQFSSFDVWKNVAVSDMVGMDEMNWSFLDENWWIRSHLC